MRRISSGLLLVAMTTLMVELSLVRVFDVIWHSNMAYMIITMVMFCFGLSGVFLSLWPVHDERKAQKILCTLSIAFSLSLALLMPVMNSIPIDLRNFQSSSMINIGLFLVMYGCIALPFFISGLILTVIFSCYSGRIQTLYFWDLLGAAVGCIILIPFLPIIGPGGLVIGGAGIGFFAAALFLDRKKISTLLCLVGIVFLAVPFVRSFTAEDSVSKYFEFKHHVNKRNVKAHVEEGHIEETRWDPISKIDIIDLGMWKHVAYDGGSQSSYMMPFDGDFEKLRKSLPGNTLGNFTSEAVYLSHALKEGTSKNVLIIGSAAGQETKAALTFGAEHVDTVELVSFVVRAGKDIYNEYNGNIFNDPRVSAHVGEGRSFLRASGKKYDVIQVFSNHTSSSIAAGSGAMATTYLQTADAYKEYFSHLEKDGILHINHHVYPRMVTTAAKAWKELGRTDFRKHVLVYSGRKTQDNLPTFLVRMTPWTQKEVDDIRNMFGGIFQEPVENPLDPDSSMLSDEFYSGEMSRETRDKVPFRIVASTDDRPYFNFLRKEWEHYKRGYPEVFMDYATAALLSSQAIYKSPESNKYEMRLIPTDVVHLFVTSAAALLFAAVFILLPLLFAKAGRVKWPGKAVSLGYFACLGSGFIILELVYIQIFMKLIGFPLYTYSVVVCGLLIAAGIGSYASHKLGVTPTCRWRLPFIGTLLTTALFLAVREPYFNYFLTFPTGVRILSAVILLLPLGFFLGMCFPLGILSVRHQPLGVIAWSWGMNGLFTVIGGIVSVILSIYLGFTVTMVIGMAIYVLAFILYSRMRKSFI